MPKATLRDRAHALGRVLATERERRKQQRACPRCRSTTVETHSRLVEQGTGRQVSDSGVGYALRGVALLVAGLFFIGYAGSLYVQSVSREATSQFVLGMIALISLFGLGLILYGRRLVQRRSVKTRRETRSTCQQCGYQW